MIRNSLLFASILLFLTSSVKAQEALTDSIEDPQINQARGMVSALAYYYNLLGDKKTSVAEKETIINSSYNKLFLGPKVQVEDDLQENRSVVIYKDVQAYLKDIDFFFDQVRFEFEVQEVKKLFTLDSVPYYRVEMIRNLNAVSIQGDSINNTQQRFIEFNLDDENQQLKIASIYTTKLSKEKQLREWWAMLTLGWKKVFWDKLGVYEDSLSSDELFRVVTTDSLNLSGNELIMDIEPIYQLTDLKYLKLSNTWVNDLSPLLAINRLKALDVSNTSVHGLQFLKYHKEITWLDLSNSHVEDFSVLVGMPELRHLSLRGIAGIDLSFVGELKSLESLDLQDARGVDAINFAALSRLKQLDLSGSDLTDSRRLEGLTSLVELSVSGTTLSDLKGLSGLNRLEELFIENTSVSALTELGSLPGLKKVHANGTRITDEEQAEFVNSNPDVVLLINEEELRNWWQSVPRPAKDAIEKQHGFNNPSVEELTRLVQVNALDLSGLGLENLTFLSEFNDLKTLDVSGNPLSKLEVSYISGPLESINLSNTQVRDLSPLASLSTLKKIDAKETPVSNVLKLARARTLTFLDVDRSNVREEQVAELLERNPSLVIRFKTTSLRKWWGSLPAGLQQSLRSSKKLDQKPTTDQLHQLAASKVLSVEDLDFSQEVSTALKALYRLESLRLVRVNLPAIELLPEVPTLRSLTLNEMPISSLEGIGLYPDLQELNLTNTAMEDLRPLAILTELKSLNFSGTNVRRFRGLEALSKLKSIDCSNTKVFRLDKLYNLSELKELKCFNTGLRQNDIDKFREALPNVSIVFY